jgi:peptide/nickel transport system substrate-binding protein
MERIKYSRRQFIGQVAAVGGGAVLLGACTSNSAPSSAGGGFALPPIEGPTVITDPAQFPAKFAESPDFAKLVASGKLPAVAERIGQDPLVFKPVDAIGRYGGEIQRAFQGQSDFQNGYRFLTGPDTLLYWDIHFENLRPNIARGYELSADGKTLTLQLRRGMRWSDGHPFTADDIIFWREDINLNPQLSAPSTALTTAGGPTQIKKIDDYTVQYISPVPHPVLPEMMASSTDIGGQSQFGATGGGGYAPMHYLSQYLPKYTSVAEANKKAKAANLQSWPLLLAQLMNWTLNPKLPVLTPWVVTSPISTPPWSFAANPYGIWVDTKGNQLPYISTVTMSNVENPQVLQTQAVAGAYDFQDRGLDLSSLPVLLRYQKRSKYTIYRAPQDDLNIKIRLNLSYAKDKTLGNLLRNVSFRRALSLAIDRDQINKIYMFGTAVPTAAMVASGNKYFPGAEWRSKWAAHDVKMANQLLDQIGLTKKNSSGLRLRPDNGQPIRLEFTAIPQYADFPTISDTIGQQWQEIGIASSVNNPGDAIVDQILANDVMLMTTGGFSADPFIQAHEVLPTADTQGGVMGLPYAQWWGSGGKKGVRPPAELQLEQGFQLRQKGLEEPDVAKRTEIGKQIYMLHADQVWSVGIVGFGPLLYGLYLAKDNLGNVPRRVFNDSEIMPVTNTYPNTFYYK